MMNSLEMREHVVRLVQRKVQQEDITPGSPYADVLAKLGYPPAQFRCLPFGMDGLRENKIVVVNDQSSSARQEFTVFHEITHDIVEEDGEIDSELLENHDTESNEYRWTKEELCNLGAAEFLMPSRAFSALMEANDWSIANLLATQDAFRCSLIAAAFHFAHLNPDACSIVVCEYFPRPFKKNSIIEKYDLNVSYTARNESGYLMCRNVPVPLDHIIQQAWVSKEVTTGKAQGFFRNPVGEMECEAVVFNNRVYAVFYRGKRKWLKNRYQEKLDLFAQGVIPRGLPRFLFGRARRFQAARFQREAPADTSRLAAKSFIRVMKNHKLWQEFRFSRRI